MWKSIKSLLNKPRVFIVRHGTTDLNDEDKSKDRIRGWKDIPLNHQGIGEAKEAKEKLEKATNHVDLIYCSDLIRTKQTCDEINKDFKAPVVYTKDLRPWHLGIYEGKVTKNIIDDLMDYIYNPDKIVPQGESFNMFKTRFLSFLKDIINKAVKERKMIVLVTHFRDVKTANAWCVKGFPSDLSIDEEEMKKDDFKPAEIFEVPNLKKL